MRHWANAEFFVGLFAILFGVATVLSGGIALFGGESVRAAFGDIVLFVLWFNFLAGFVYVAAGIGLAAGYRWSAPLAVAIASGTLVVFAGFGLHVASGGTFESRTVGAMTLRSLVWLAIAFYAMRARPTGLAQQSPAR